MTNLPPHLSKTGVAEKKLGQIPTGKKSKIVRAIIDTRGEPDWNLGCPTLKMALDAGDVMCELSSWTTDPIKGTKIFDQVLIERKTPSDFLSTLAKNRLFPQVARMVKKTPWSYVVITGQFYRLRTGMVKVGGRETGWNWDAVQGALLTCQEMGAGVIHCNTNGFEQAVIRICNRDRSVKRVQPARETALLTEGEQAIAALPGIGHERVQALVDKMKNPSVILEWLTDLESTIKVAGVGNGTKCKVITALGLGVERLRIVPEACTKSSFTPNGGFIAAADQAAIEYLEKAVLEGVAKDGK